MRVGDPGPPDDSDVAISAVHHRRALRSAAGRRTRAGTRTRPAGRDYIGELEATADLRVTDRFNGVDAGGGEDAATVVDFPFPVTMPVLRHPG